MIRRIFSICPHFVVQGEQLDQSLPKREYRKQDGYPDHSVCVPGSAAEGGADRAPVSSTTIATDCDKAQWPHALASIILDFLQPLLVNASHYSSLFTSPDLPLFCMTSAVAADLDTHTHTQGLKPLRMSPIPALTDVSGVIWATSSELIANDSLQR